jgi:hypothetical protein
MSWGVVSCRLASHPRGDDEFWISAVGLCKSEAASRRSRKLRVWFSEGNHRAPFISIGGRENGSSLSHRRLGAGHQPARVLKIYCQTERMLTCVKDETRALYKIVMSHLVRPGDPCRT